MFCGRDRTVSSRHGGFLFLEDRTHDIWTERIDTDFRPDAVAASLRKWAALPEGGMLQTRLGAKKAAAFDLSAACSGF